MTGKPGHGGCRTGHGDAELIGGAPVQRAGLSVPFCRGFDVAGGSGEGRSEVLLRGVEVPVPVDEVPSRLPDVPVWPVPPAPVPPVPAPAPPPAAAPPPPPPPPAPPPPPPPCAAAMATLPATKQPTSSPRYSFLRIIMNPFDAEQIDNPAHRPAVPAFLRLRHRAQVSLPATAGRRSSARPIS